MKNVLTYILAFSIFVSYAFAAPKKGVTLKIPQKKQQEKTYVNSAKVEMWPRIADSILKLSASKRHDYMEGIHTRLNQKKFVASEEPILYGILAMLHAADKNSRYAAVGLIGDVRAKWPQFAKVKEAESLWEAFLEFYDGDTIADEFALAQIAGLMNEFKPQKSLLATEFSYYKALSLIHEGKESEALNSLAQMTLESSNYRKAKFLEGSLLLKQNKVDEAQEALQVVIHLEPTEAEKKSRIHQGSIQRVRELAVLNMARILYERKRFGESLAYYRSLTQDSNYFFEALSEQAWPFFMSGYPNRALGAAYAATSPFFTHYLNPDSYFLMAAVYYWLCNFDLAFQSVQAFIDHTKLEGDALRNLVAQTNAMSKAQRLKRYAKILEDDYSGVSYLNIGIGPKALSVLKAKPYLTQYVESLAEVTNQRNSVASPDAYPQGRDRILTALLQYEERLREALGEAVMSELNVLSSDLERSLSQVRLIHLEVLTAKKDAILGKERTVKGSEFVGQEREFEELKTPRQQQWNQDKNEFWYDELGHYVFDLKSQCKISQKN